MRSVAILLNSDKEGAVKLALELIPWLTEQRVEVSIESCAAARIGCSSLGRSHSELKDADLAIVLGGDGTLLRANRLLAGAGIPMFALKFGQFGFMTDTEPKDARDALTRILRGEYRIDERMMLEATLYRDDSVVGEPSTALNDVVIAKGPLARMLRLGTHVSGKYVSTYPADGLIVATPTGSTAYSLSAGGPVVSPDLQVILITPICPHTLNARSLIISSKQVVDVVVESDPNDVVMLTVDGQVGIALKAGDRVSVREADLRAKLVSVDGTSFFDKLQKRLGWGTRFDTQS